MTAPAAGFSSRKTAGIDATNEVFAANVQGVPPDSKKFSCFPSVERPLRVKVQDPTVNVGGDGSDFTKATLSQMNVTVSPSRMGMAGVKDTVIPNGWAPATNRVTVVVVAVMAAAGESA